MDMLIYDDQALCSAMSTRRLSPARYLLLEPASWLSLGMQQRNLPLVVDYAQTLACMQPCGEAGGRFRGSTFILGSSIMCKSHVQDHAPFRCDCLHSIH
jgi:hypothetical protein